MASVGAFLFDIGMRALEILLPSLATVIAGLFVAVLAKQLKKMGIEVTNAQDERLRQLVRDGIMAAEEASHRSELSSAEKHALAANQAIARAPETTLATANRVVDQELPRVRAELWQAFRSKPTIGGPKTQTTF